MWIRPLAMMVVLQASLAATAAPVAESLHLSTAGAVVSGSFNLAGKEIPLPEGEFLLAATETRGQRVSVFLAQLDGERLRSAVWATIAPAPPTHENRLAVEQRVRSFGPEATGITKEAAAWLAYHDVLLPVPVMVVAEITRIDRHERIRVSYAFNPWSYGCDAAREPFTESVTAWGKAVQQHFDKRVELPGIHQCASALAGQAQSIAAPRTPLASPCSARTMRVSTLCE